MDEVLGNNEDVEDLIEEMRLLREQTSLMAQELRLLRERLHQGPAQGAQEAAPSKSAATAAAAAPPPAPAAPPAAPLPAASHADVQQEVEEEEEEEDSGDVVPPGRTVAKIVSAGFETGNRADFYLDGERIAINGFSFRRGLNVVIIDPDREEVVSRNTYDIWGDPAAENIRLASDLVGVPDGHLVLVALKDSGMENIDGSGVSALKGVGATLRGPLGVREGYALIGVKGGTALVERRGPNVEVEAVLPCRVALPPPPPPLPQMPAPGARFGMPGSFPPPPGGPSAAAPSFATAPGFAARGAGAAPVPSWRPPPAPPASVAAGPRAAARPPSPPFPGAVGVGQQPSWSAPATPPPWRPGPAAPAPAQPFPTAAAPPRSAPAPPQPPPWRPAGGEGGGAPKPTFNAAMAEDFDGDKSWEEVVLLLDELQEKIRARKAAGEMPLR